MSMCDKRFTAPIRLLPASGVTRVIAARRRVRAKTRLGVFSSSAPSPPSRAALLLNTIDDRRGRMTLFPQRRTRLPSSRVKPGFPPWQECPPPPEGRCVPARTHNPDPVARYNGFYSLPEHILLVDLSLRRMRREETPRSSPCVPRGLASACACSAGPNPFPVRPDPVASPSAPVREPRRRRPAYRSRLPLPADRDRVRLLRRAGSPGASVPADSSRSSRGKSPRPVALRRHPPPGRSSPAELL